MAETLCSKAGDFHLMIVEKIWDISENIELPYTTRDLYKAIVRKIVRH